MKESKHKQRIKSHKKLPLKRALLSSRLRCQQLGLLQTTTILDAGWPPRYPHKIIYEWEAWVPCASKLPKLEKMMKKMQTTLVCCSFTLCYIYFQEWSLLSHMLIILIFTSFCTLYMRKKIRTLEHGEAAVGCCSRELHMAHNSWPNSWLKTQLAEDNFNAN